LIQGTSAASTITKFDVAHFPVKRACEVRHYRPSPSASVLDPFIQYGLTATEEAVRASGLNVSAMDPYRIGIAVSSSKGGMTTLERFRERFFKRPSALLAARVYANLIPNILSQWIARRLKIRGPSHPVVAACATGTYAIIEGIRMIEDREVDVCIAGASDASITQLMLAGYHQMGVLSPDEIRPFDRKRNGFLVGEGAGIVILESERHAKARAAKIFGRILSYGFGSETGDLIHFPPESDGLERCFTRTFRAAGIGPKEIDCLYLHGTATKAGDFYETIQLKKACGGPVYGISTTAIKSMIGHTVGASGAISFVAGVLSLQDQFVPPTIHLDHPDPECDLDYTPHKAKQKKITIAGSIAMGFGGHVAAILVGK